MLKLEKNAQQNQISVIFRNKESMYTRSFAIAFFIACGMHLFFLLLFRVVPITLRFNEVIFPPVRVEAELFLKAPWVMTEAEQLPKYPLGIPLPLPSTPHLPDHPHFLSLSHIGYFDEKNLQGNPFANLEKEIHQPQITPLSKPLPRPIEIRVSGPLAEMAILKDEPTALPSFSKHQLLQEGKVVYRVLVEGRSGRIFWHEAKERSQIPALNQYVEKMLRELFFEASPGVFVIDGEIEWHFHPLQEKKGND